MGNKWLIWGLILLAALMIPGLSRSIRGVLDQRIRRVAGELWRNTADFSQRAQQAAKYAQQAQQLTEE